MRKITIILLMMTPFWGSLHVTGDPKWVIGVSQCNLVEPFQAQVNEDIRRAAMPHSEFKLIFKNAQNDTLKQCEHVEQFVSSEVNILILSPKETAPLRACVAEAFRKKIPIIVLERKVPGDNYTTFIGTDNRRIGNAAGTWIAQRLNKQGKVVELKGLMTSTSGQERHAGFLEGIRGSGIQVVFEADMKWLEADAKKEMEAALAANRQIDLVYAHSDAGARGAYLAARAAGRQEEMSFVGIDALPQEGRMYVRQGILAASFEYPTGGKEAIETALKILAGQKVPKEIRLRSRVFTPEDLSGRYLWYF